MFSLRSVDFGVFGCFWLKCWAFFAFLGDTGLFGAAGVAFESIGTSWEGLVGVVVGESGVTSEAGSCWMGVGVDVAMSGGRPDCSTVVWVVAFNDVGLSGAADGEVGTLEGVGSG